MVLPSRTALAALVIFISGFGWEALCLAQTSSSGQPQPATLNGTVVDHSGAVVAGARVKLTHDASATQPAIDPPVQESLSNTNGQFFFPSVTPGPFRLAITIQGFAMQSLSGTLNPAEVQTLPPIVLDVATAVTNVNVGGSQFEVAEEQIKEEEHQRVLGIVPNFYVSYVPDAAPLTAGQKFRLAFRSVIDPVTFVIVGGTAGVEQAQDHFSEYGQGAAGYGKRFGAGYADAVSGTFIGGAILPSILKQDPRYFYKGTGSFRSRAFYAIANAVICKGDNKRWQVNYSNILGNLAAGGISNLYYPSQDRNGFGLTFENAAIGLGSSAIGNLLEEFVIRKLTPKLPKRDAVNP